jgi:hypothetical protein
MISRVCSLFSSVGNGWLVNLRSSDALRGKRMIVGWEGQGV